MTVSDDDTRPTVRWLLDTLYPETPHDQIMYDFDDALRWALIELWLFRRQTK